MLVRIPFIYSFPVRHKTTGKQAGIAFLGVPRLGALFQNLIHVAIRLHSTRRAPSSLVQCRPVDHASGPLNLVWFGTARLVARTVPTGKYTGFVAVKLKHAPPSLMLPPTAAASRTAPYSGTRPLRRGRVGGGRGAHAEGGWRGVKGYALRSVCTVVDSAGEVRPPG